MKQLSTFALYDVKHDKFINKLAFTPGLRHAQSPKVWNAAWKCARALRDFQEHPVQSKFTSNLPSFDNIQVIEMSTSGPARRWSAGEFLSMHPKSLKRRAAPWFSTPGLVVGGHTIGNQYVVAMGPGRYLKRAVLVAASKTRLRFKSLEPGSAVERLVLAGRAHLDVFPLT